MSFLQKFLRRRSENKKAKELAEAKIQSDDTTTCSTTETYRSTDHTEASSNVTNGDVDDLTTSDSDSDEETEKEAMLLEMRRQLRSMNRQQERRRRRRGDVIAMEAEIQELISMISRFQLHSKALDEEILNKKCEIRFLQTEGPDDHDMHVQVKKSHSLLYKKYTHIKGSNEAKALLTVVRQNQRALQYLELMTYNRYLERQHGIHCDPVRKRTNLLLKDKTKSFGHLVDSIHAKKLTLKRQEPRVTSPLVQTSAEETTDTTTTTSNNSSFGTTHVTVASSPTSSSSPTPFAFGFPMMSMAQESTMFGGTTTANSGPPPAPRIPTGLLPFETSL